MADTTPLRHRLLRALDLASLTLVVATSVGCTVEDEEAAKRLEVAKQREQSAREIEAAAAAVRQANNDQAVLELERQRAKLAADAKALEDAKALADAKAAADAAALDLGMPHFSCPSGEWCGTKTSAKRHAGETMPEHPAALGCPGNLAPGDGVPPTDPLGAPPANFGYAYLDTAATEAARTQGQANACCYDWGSLCGGGRPLLDEGQPKFATLERIGSSTRHAAALDLDPRIAAGWLDDARMEHASIASFLRAEAELAALAAPLPLREACLRAAEDERRHARDCFAIAAEYGEAWRARELPHAPMRPASLEQLAVDTLLEGGIGETIAALMATRAARAAEGDPTIAAVLEQIAADELEHAALAWQTIAWAVARGGESVRIALQSAAAGVRPSHFELPTADPNADELARHGRLDGRAKARAVHDAWSDLINPVLVQLAS